MGGELGPIRDESNKVSFGQATSTKADGSTINEPILIFKHKESLTTVVVSRFGIKAEDEDNSFYISYTSLARIRYDEKKLEITSYQGGKKSILRAGDGGIIFDQNFQEFEQGVPQAKPESVSSRELTFAQKARHYRLALGLTQAEMAKRLGVSATKVKEYEGGKLPGKCPHFEKAFGCEENDPRVQEIRAVYLSELPPETKREPRKR